MYSASGFTAAATLAGRVHGVVVQINRNSPGRWTSGNRTKTDGSVLSRYTSLCDSSCWDMDVPHRGHHSVDRRPVYSHPRSWISLRKRQMYSMFVSENV